MARSPWTTHSPCLSPSWTVTRSATSLSHQLLTHTAGVPLRANLRALYGTDPAAIRRGVLHEQLHRPPGEAVEYTHRAALILGFLIERLTGTGLDDTAHERIWGPLGVTETRFGPLPPHLAARCAPTELDEQAGVHLKGIAHDFSARLLDGVCGIAGIFSTLADTENFLRYLLDPTVTPDAPGFGPAWVAESLQPHTGDLEPVRGLFWLLAPGTDPADDIYVHYGFTGTGMWISPKQRRWAVLLTNMPEWALRPPTSVSSTVPGYDGGHDLVGLLGPVGHRPVPTAPVGCAPACSGRGVGCRFGTDRDRPADTWCARGIRTPRSDRS